ncbi:MAG: hypothetical protein ACFFDR_05570 [Candidatus Thorarchaeota archaeon]
MKERLTAIRASVSDIIDGEYGDDEGPYVISPQGVELRRVMLVGSIVDQVPGNNFASITIEDDTGSILAKAWGAEAGLLEKVSTNILALVVGKIREYNSEIYIQPEIVKPVDDPNIMIMHKYERQMAIIRSGGKGPAKRKTDEGSLMSFDQKRSSGTPKQSTVEDVSGLAGQILAFIRERDNPTGVSIQEIAKHFEEKGFDKLQVNAELINLFESEKVVEQEVGSYRPSS